MSSEGFRREIFGTRKGKGKAPVTPDTASFTIIDSPRRALAHARDDLQQLMRRQQRQPIGTSTSAAGSNSALEPNPRPQISYGPSTVDSAKKRLQLEQLQRSNNFPWSIRRLAFLPPITVPLSTLGSPHTLTQHPSPPPFPRYGHALPLTAATNGELYLFGGLVEESFSSDLYLFSTRDLSAALLHTVGDRPTPRVGHASALRSTVLIVWGGDTRQGGSFEINETLDDGLYVFSTSMLEWTRVRTEGRVPIGRYGHTATMVNTKFFMFAGQVNGQFFNDLWAFELNLKSTTVWEEYRPASNKVPPARTGHICVTHDEKIYLFGGTDGQYHYNDTWAFDVATRTWNELNTIGHLPVAREGHATALVDDVIYVFGGRGVDGKDLDDLAGFKISNQRWYTFQNMGPKPSGRSGHAMASSGTRIFVLGGESFDATAREKVDFIHVLDTKYIKYPGPVGPRAPIFSDVDLLGHPGQSKNIGQWHIEQVDNNARRLSKGGSSFPETKGGQLSTSVSMSQQLSNLHDQRSISPTRTPMSLTPLHHDPDSEDYGFEIINMYTQPAPHKHELYSSPRHDSLGISSSRTSLEDDDQTQTSSPSEPFSRHSTLCLDDQIKNRSKYAVASGGYADIWTGLLGTRTVAVKTTRAFSSMGTPIQRSKLLKRIWREYLVWSPLSHPNVLECLGFSYDFTSDSEQPEVPSLISPWMSNSTVLSYVEANRNVDRLKIVIGIAKGLLYLHNQDPVIVHGDIRAGNILVSDAGIPCLTDFGLSRILGDAKGMTTSSDIAGSLRWMAPELLHGDKVSVSSDVWAYGMAILEIMSGKRPYYELDREPMVLRHILDGRVPSRPAGDSDNSRSALPVPDRVWEICLQCWHLQPTERPSVRKVMAEWKGKRKRENVVVTNSSSRVVPSST